jgi:hypothetical protein
MGQHHRAQYEHLLDNYWGRIIYLYSNSFFSFILMLEIEDQVVLTNMYKYMLHYNLQFVWWVLNKIEKWMDEKPS